MIPQIRLLAKGLPELIIKGLVTFTILEITTLSPLVGIIRIRQVLNHPVPRTYSSYIHMYTLILKLILFRRVECFIIVAPSDIVRVVTVNNFKSF